MRITIEIDSNGEMEKLSALFKTFKINAVKIIASDETAIAIQKGDKKINPKSLFGIWANEPRSLENIRESAWQKTTHS